MKNTFVAFKIHSYLVVDAARRCFNPNPVSWKQTAALLWHTKATKDGKLSFSVGRLAH